MQQNIIWKKIIEIYWVKFYLEPDYCLLQIDWGDIGSGGDITGGDIDFGDDINFDMSEITIETGGSAEGTEAQVIIFWFNRFLFKAEFLLNRSKFGMGKFDNGFF